MLFLLFFMNRILSDSTIFYICPIIQEPLEKTAVNSMDEKFFIFNFSLLIFQTLDHYLEKYSSKFHLKTEYESLEAILCAIYISTLLKYDDKITKEEMKVKETEERIKNDFLKYMKIHETDFHKLIKFNLLKNEKLIQKIILNKFLEDFCQQLSNYFIEIYKTEKEMLNEVLKFNIKIFSYFITETIISVKQKIIFIKHEFCENKNIKIADLSKFKKTDFIHLNSNFCIHQVITNSLDTDYPLENFRKDVTNFYDQMFFLIKKLYATSNNIVLITRNFENMYFNDLEKENLLASEIDLDFLRRIIYNYIRFIIIHIYFLLKKNPLNRKNEDIENIIEITVFSYTKDNNSNVLFRKKYYENEKSYLEIGKKNVSIIIDTSAIAEYFVYKNKIKNIINFIREEEKQNDDTCNKSEESDTELINIFKCNNIKENKAERKQKKKRKNKNKKVEDKNSKKCLDDIDIVENEKSDTELDKINVEKEQECIDEIDFSKKLDEKLKNENKSVNVINNSDEELKKINDDYDLKCMELDISKETSSSKKTMNENIMNINEKSNNEFKDTKNQQNNKQQEQNEKLQGCVQKIKEQHQEIKKQERQEFPKIDSSNCDIPTSNSKNTQSDDFQLRTKLNITKKNNTTAKHNIFDSYTSSIGSKSTYSQDYEHQTRKDKKHFGYQQQNVDLNFTDKSHLNIAPNYSQYTKTNFTKPRIPQNFRHQPDTIEQQYGYQGQNHRMGFKDKVHSSLSHNVIKYDNTRIAQCELSKKNNLQTDTIEKQYDFQHKNNEMSSGNSDKLSYTTPKITVKKGNLLDNEKKYNFKSSEEHKQQIPTNLKTKKENLEVVESQSIKSNNLSEEDLQFEKDLLYWCSK